MHFNDTGMKKYSDDEFIFNIQSPSLSAYIPAYKVLTVKDKNTIDVNKIPKNIFFIINYFNSRVVITF